MDSQLGASFAQQELTYVTWLTKRVLETNSEDARGMLLEFFACKEEFNRNEITRKYVCPWSGRLLPPYGTDEEETVVKQVGLMPPSDMPGLTARWEWSTVASRPGVCAGWQGTIKITPPDEFIVDCVRQHKEKFPEIYAGIV